MALLALTGARVFTGERFIDGQAVLVDGSTITTVTPLSQVPEDAERIALAGGVLVPGFVDAQVNGGGGILFNERPDAASVDLMAQAHGRHGSTALMPTFITDRPEGMAAALAAVRKSIDEGVPGIAGIHLEGPFLSVARKGAHDPELIRPMTDADVELILSAGLATVLITVAPETVPPALIRRLADNDVVVSLGHTDASYETVMAAADAGARGVTHLFNAMSQFQHRAPGVVGAALDHGALWCGIIADGHHVHPAALSNALRAKRGPGRLFLVTDAMPTAGHDGDMFHLNGRKVMRRDGALTLEDGTLAGSDLTMEAAVRFAVANLDVSLEEALRMASLYPATFLTLEDRGRIAAGFRADLVHLDDRLVVQEVWIGGENVSARTRSGGGRSADPEPRGK
jgi:N-acetylglucosamine-6-phosphate deacetylase